MLLKNFASYLMPTIIHSTKYKPYELDDFCQTFVSTSSFQHPTAFEIMPGLTHPLITVQYSVGKSVYIFFFFLCGKHH